MSTPVPAPQIALVLGAGEESYIKLADVVTPRVETADDLPESWDNGPAPVGAVAPIAMPRHGALRYQAMRADALHLAIAPVADADVPALFARWAGRPVVVDERCTAHVAGFAIVYLVSRDPHLDRLSVAHVARYGHAVLAARLDRCQGASRATPRNPA